MLICSGARVFNVDGGFNTLGADGLPAVTGMCVHMWGPAPDPRAKRAVFFARRRRENFEIFVAIFMNFLMNLQFWPLPSSAKTTIFRAELH